MIETERIRRDNPCREEILKEAGKHPSYPNPTIREAVAGIHFQLPESAAWKPSSFIDFYRHIQGDFPTFEPVPVMGIEMMVGPGSVNQALLPQRPMMRYRHRDRSILLQLAANLLTVNVLPKYEGWARMLTDVEAGWAAVKNIIKPAKVTRLSLRYINYIERNGPKEEPGQWIVHSDYVSNSVLESKSGFFYRSQVRPEDSVSFTTTLADTPDGKNIVLDIESVSDKEVGSDAILKREMIALHELVWRVFSASMSPRLRKRLEGKE